MKSGFLRRALRLLVLPLLLHVLAGSAVAVGAPSAAAEGQGALLAGAQKEGALVIYAAIDRQTGELLIKDFNALYPGIKVYLVDQAGAEVFNNYMVDQGKRREAADLLWSAEVDLQAALVKDGYAMKYHSAESGNIYPWANLRDMAYAVAFEPVAMVYNRKLLAEKDLPATHKALLKFVAEERFKNKIGTCDPEKNARAFLYLTGDQGSGFNFWTLVKGLGAAGLKLYADYATLLDRVSAGETLFGYNVPAQDAYVRAKADPNLGYFYPGDYTLAVPQTILITRGAPHPNAARLWIDYLLSARGQEIVARGGNLFPVLADVAGGEIAREPQKLPAGKGLKTMMPAGEITRYNEKGIRRGFVLRWKQRLNLVK